MRKLGGALLAALLAVGVGACTTDKDNESGAIPDNLNPTPGGRGGGGPGLIDGKNADESHARERAGQSVIVSDQYRWRWSGNPANGGRNPNDMGYILNEDTCQVLDSFDRPSPGSAPQTLSVNDAAGQPLGQVIVTPDGGTITFTAPGSFIVAIGPKASDVGDSCGLGDAFSSVIVSSSNPGTYDGQMP